MNSIEFFIRRKLAGRISDALIFSDHLSRSELIARYREFDIYEPDIIVTPACIVDLPAVLPSEPPEGVRYYFCASGYFTRGRDPEYCVIHSAWRNIKNYCHWTLTEIPFILLALESPAQQVVIPDELLDASQPFHRQWWEILYRHYPQKTIIRLSEFDTTIKGILPVNHDTSSMQGLVGRCAYSYYHHGRATPYCLEKYIKLLEETGLRKQGMEGKDAIYINRKSRRRLVNEAEVQLLVRSYGIEIVSLEDFSLTEQMGLFASAKIIIGFHGAGLANLVYSHPESRVVEIVDSDCVYPSWRDGLVIPGAKAPRTYFHMIAEMKGMNYFCLKTIDYCLDLGRLECLIQELLLAA